MAWGRNAVGKMGPEARIKRRCVKILNEVGLVWWRNQSGSIKFKPESGGKARHMHMCPAGTPDLMLISKYGRLVCVELKAPKGTLSQDQEEFRDKILAMTSPERPLFYVVRDPVELLKICNAARGFTAWPAEVLK